MDCIHLSALLKQGMQSSSATAWLPATGIHLKSTPPPYAFFTERSPDLGLPRMVFWMVTLVAALQLLKSAGAGCVHVQCKVFVSFKPVCVCVCAMCDRHLLGRDTWQLCHLCHQFERVCRG